jgi:cbb3-type cytochrome oxidase subunit 3
MTGAGRAALVALLAADVAMVWWIYSRAKREAQRANVALSAWVREWVDRNVKR